MMIVDLAALKDSQTFDFTLAPDEVNLESEAAKLKNVVKTKGKIKKGIVQTDVEGEIFADVEVDCSRCLQPTESSLEIPFRAVFIEPENHTEAEEAELEIEDLEVAPLTGGEINLTELVREQILLNLPTQVFCQEDCQGLCQQCGANRNLIDCNCQEKEIDPRWSALKNLK
ncbi:MAG: DUF177 domain-containing protein [Acidobacteria bacterium]|nr:DUF177 domain-containing protein [Acidobacteriota bacterium]